MFKELTLTELGRVAGGAEAETSTMDTPAKRTEAVTQALALKDADALVPAVTLPSGKDEIVRDECKFGGFDVDF